MVFDDFLAGDLLTADEIREIDNRRIERAGRLAPELTGQSREFILLQFHLHLGTANANFLSRARYNEEQLEDALARGVAQYVILGAGLDTFAWRRPDLADRVQIFELDHPSSQEFKRARLAAAGLALPAHLHFGPADFEKETVADVLGRLPFDPGQPAISLYSACPTT